MDCWNKKRDLFKMNTFTVACLIMVTSITSCNILGGGDDDPPLEPGPRNYTWQVDTVANGPSGWLYDIWGSSQEDIWAVASSGLHTLWHFDGETWEPAQNIYSFETVFGFSKTDVWAGGGDGRIYHFDGTSWKLNYMFNKPGMYSCSVTDIWGGSGANVYAVGTFYMSNEPRAQGFVLYYDGNEWREVLTTDYGVQFHRVRADNKLPLILGTKIREDSTTDEMIIYSLKSKTLEIVFPNTIGEGTSIWLNDVLDDVFITTENSIITYKGEEILSFSDRKDIVGVYGRNRKDLLILTGNQVLHNNGENTVSLLEDLPLNVYRSQLFTEEVFFVVWDFDNGTNLIYHGTLTDQEGE